MDVPRGFASVCFCFCVWSFVGSVGCRKEGTSRETTQNDSLEKRRTCATRPPGLLRTSRLAHRAFVNAVYTFRTHLCEDRNT